LSKEMSSPSEVCAVKVGPCVATLVAAVGSVAFAEVFLCRLDAAGRADLAQVGDESLAGAHHLEAALFVQVQEFWEQIQDILDPPPLEPRVNTHPWNQPGRRC